MKSNYTNEMNVQFAIELASSKSISDYSKDSNAGVSEGTDGRFHLPAR